MLAPVYRLRKNYQYRYVYSHGKTVAGRMFLLVSCPSKRAKPCIGISVSNKVGHAVLRNRIKRLLRESVRKLLPELQPHRNFILAASNKFVFGKDLPFLQVLADVRTLCKKAGLLGGGLGQNAPQ